jgi:hypothetical protein
MAAHAEYTLRRPGIAQVLNLPLTVPTPKAGCAECLVPSQDGQILNLIPTRIAAVCAVVAYKRSIAEKEEVCVGVEKGIARVAPKAVEMPAKPSYEWVSRGRLSSVRMAQYRLTAGQRHLTTKQDTER